MFGHDTRRTGRSPFRGPSTYTPGSPRNYAYTAAAARIINMQPTVTDRGVYFGSWGINREPAPMSYESRVKSDGHVYGLFLDPRGSDAAQEIFAPFDPFVLAACYRHPGRARTSGPGGIDEDWCGAADPSLLVTYYNGTIEGTALVDPIDGTLYVGRGEGNLFAIDPDTGALRWTFRSFDPADRTDPEGGGEVVGGAVMDPRGRIYFVTWGIPWPGSATEPAYETHAVYAVDRSGALLWRWPSTDSHAEAPFLAAPALSPDGRTLYVGTYYSTTTEGALLALDLDAADGAADEARLRWRLPLVNGARMGSPRVWVRHVSVGADGVIYVGALEAGFAKAVPAVLAVRDEGSAGVVSWLVEPQGFPVSDGDSIAGLALWEEGGAVTRVYASTTQLRTAILGRQTGRLYELDPATGATRATFDPSALVAPQLGGLTSPTLGDDGIVYVGVRGTSDGLARPDAPSSQWRPGAVFALRRDASSGFDVVWSMPLPGENIDWAHAAIGADGALYFGSSAMTPTENSVSLGGGLLPVFFGPDEVPPFESPHFYRVIE
jgi:outer membrane protein assembly factor BamB